MWLVAILFADALGLTHYKDIPLLSSRNTFVPCHDVHIVVARGSVSLYNRIVLLDCLTWENTWCLLSISICCSLSTPGQTTEFWCFPPLVCSSSVLLIYYDLTVGSRHPVPLWLYVIRLFWQHFGRMTISWVLAFQNIQLDVSGWRDPFCGWSTLLAVVHTYVYHMFRLFNV